MKKLTRRVFNAASTSALAMTLLPNGISEAVEYDPLEIRTVVMPEGDMWVAQCLEYDIGAQAPGLELLQDRLCATIAAHCDISCLENKTPFNGIDPAPEYFHEIWERHEIRLKPLMVSDRLVWNKKHIRLEMALVDYPGRIYLTRGNYEHFLKLIDRAPRSMVISELPDGARENLMNDIAGAQYGEISDSDCDTRLEDYLNARDIEEHTPVFLRGIPFGAWVSQKQYERYISLIKREAECSGRYLRMGVLPELAEALAEGKVDVV